MGLEEKASLRLQCDCFCKKKNVNCVKMCRYNVSTLEIFVLKDKC